MAFSSSSKGAGHTRLRVYSAPGWPCLNKLHLQGIYFQIRTHSLKGLLCLFSSGILLGSSLFLWCLHLVLVSWELWSHTMNYNMFLSFLFSEFVLDWYYKIFSLSVQWNSPMNSFCPEVCFAGMFQITNLIFYLIEGFSDLYFFLTQYC